METTLNNYFNIPQASEMFCVIEEYGSSHSALIIKVQHPIGKSLYELSFTTPIYFKCPAVWKGAAFRLATSEEQILLWQHLNSLMSQEGFLEHLTLFIAQVDTDLSNNNTVQILASRGRVYKVEE